MSNPGDVIVRRATLRVYGPTSDPELVIDGEHESLSIAAYEAAHNVRFLQLIGTDYALFRVKELYRLVP